MLIYVLIFIEDKLIQITPMALKMALMALKCYLIKNRFKWEAYKETGTGICMKMPDKCRIPCKVIYVYSGRYMQIITYNLWERVVTVC